MANIRANGNGDWNTPATWVGGVVPTSADDVYANNFIVTIDVNITVLSLRNTVGTSITAGGYFTVTTNRTIVANIIGGTAGTRVVNLATGTTTIITGSVTAGSVSAGVLANGTAILTVNGNVMGGGSSTALGLSLTSSGNVTVNGHVYGSITAQASGFGCGGVYNGTLTITGNAVANLASAVQFTDSASAHTVNILGSATGGYGTTIIGVWANRGTYNIYGNSIGGGNSSAGGFAGTNCHGSYSQSAGATTINIFGRAIGGSGVSSYGVACNSTLVTVNVDICEASETVMGAYNVHATFASIYTRGIINASNGILGTRGIILWKNVSNVFYVANTTQSAVVATLRDIVVGSGSVPSPSDVRKGTIYDSGTKTGTLEVPSPTLVKAGELTDNTVGSLAGLTLSGADKTAIATASQNIILDELTVINNGVKKASILVPHTTNL